MHRQQPRPGILNVIPIIFLSTLYFIQSNNGLHQQFNDGLDTSSQPLCGLGYFDHNSHISLKVASYSLLSAGLVMLAFTHCLPKLPANSCKARMAYACMPVLLIGVLAASLFSAAYNRSFYNGVEVGCAQLQKNATAIHALQLGGVAALTILDGSLTPSLEGFPAQMIKCMLFTLLHQLLSYSVHRLCHVRSWRPNFGAQSGSVTPLPLHEPSLENLKVPFR